MFTIRRGPTPTNGTSLPDLQTHLEDLLNTVWEAEANWRLDDRIDLALSREMKEVHA